MWQGATWIVADICKMLKTLKLLPSLHARQITAQREGNMQFTNSVFTFSMSGKPDHHQ